MSKVTRSSCTPQATFGAIDGYLTATALVAGSKHLLIGLVLAVAVAGALSMAWGEFISDNDVGWRQAGVMGIATAAGTAVPCIPVLFLPQALGIPLAALLGIGMALGSGYFRGGKYAYLIALAGFFLVAIPTVLVGLAFGGA